MHADRTVSLERTPDGYREPHTGTIIRRIEHYGGEGHHAGQTVWELDSGGDGTAIVRTLGEAREFLAPYVRLAGGSPAQKPIGSL